MKVYNLTQKEFAHLEKVKIENTTNKDGQLFYLPANDKVLLFKKFYDIDPDDFLNKICTIINLYNQKQDMKINGLAYPNVLITIDGMLSGYARDYIDGISLKEILSNPDTPFEIKKNCLIQIGKILENMQYARLHSNHNDFFLNDIHEGNFMLENATFNIKAIDLDSVSISGNYTSPSMYLRPASRLTQYKSKYILEKYNPIYEKQIVPNQDTEIYCYSMMILNYLYGDKIAYMPGEMLQRYLDYLSTLNYNPNLLNAFSKLYSNEPNINPVNFMEDFQENEKTNIKVYLRSLKRKYMK